MPIEAVVNFWKQAMDELARVSPEATLEPVEEQSGREFITYRVVMQSLGGQRIRAWYSVPRGAPPGGRFAAVLAAPGYGGDKAIPVQLVLEGYAVLTLYPRGQGESRAEWDLESGTKLTYNLTDRQRYYYRGAYMDCVRGLDFLCSRSELDPGRLGMWSRSQGGGFTLATAALDSRLKAAVAEEPFLCNYPVSAGIATHPYGELAEYLAAHPDQRKAALETLAYFDCLTLADAIECPTLMNIGMQDEACPQDTIMPVFERIRAPKAVVVYPDLAHSPCVDFNAHAHGWLRRYLGG